MNLLMVRKIAALLSVVLLALIFQNCGNAQSSNDSLESDPLAWGQEVLLCSIMNAQGVVESTSYLNWSGCEADCLNTIKTDAQTTCSLGGTDITPAGT